MIIIDGIEYEEFVLRYWTFNEDESMEEFENRYSSESSKITHWYCQEGDPSLEVTDGKVYEVNLSQSEIDQDLFIINDSGSPSMVWIMLEGTFLIKKS